MATDPICSMRVDEATALRAERDGATFYFCSEYCRKKFLAEAQPANNAACKPAEGKAVYTCPMHPEVQEDHPGDCPKCGMPLELRREKYSLDFAARIMKSLKVIRYMTYFNLREISKKR